MGNNTITDYLYENEYKRPDTIVIINCVLNVPLIVTAYYFAIAVSIPIYLLLSIVSYMRIYLIICRHRLKIRAQRNAVANSTQDYQRKHNMERKSKSAKNTFMYFVVMVVCYLPLFTAMIILTFYTSLWTIAWNLTDTIAFANSAINPFLYCWRVLKS